MATARRPLLLCLALALCLCCRAPCLSAADGGRRELPGAGGGYRVEAVAVDKGGTRLRAELVAADVGGGVASAAYGEDVRKLDVYARCDSYIGAIRTFDYHNSYMCCAFGLLVKAN
ncbi:unnamed protein product [Urochloa humidicola]